MTNSQLAKKLTKEAAPRCSPSDVTTDFSRYVVWLENPVRTIKANNKKDLLRKVLSDLNAH